MKLILLTIGIVLLSSEVASWGGKIKVCYPKKKSSLSEVPADLSFDQTFKEISNFPDEITINMTIPLNFSNEVIVGTGHAKNLKFSNFFNFTVCTFQKVTEPMNITLNTLTIRGEEYNISGVVGDLFDIYGNGSFEINIHRFSFAVNNLFPAFPLGCFHIDLNIALHSMEAKFENMMNGDDLLLPLFNKVIGDLGPDFIDFVWPPLYDVLVPFINKFLDKYVNKLEIGNFIEATAKGGEKQKNCFDFPKNFN